MALDFPTSPTDGQIYDNYYWDNTNSVWRLLSDSLEIAANFSNTATGTYTDGYDYKYVSFTADGVLTVTRGGYADILVVGGGGAGGGGDGGGGGGGAGGYLYVENAYLPAGSLDVVVGAGGAGGGSTGDNAGYVGNNGETSRLGSYYSPGGGAGSSFSRSDSPVKQAAQNGLNGASGGGAGGWGHFGPPSGGLGISAVGNDGGTQTVANQFTGGGGGGASAAGGSTSNTTAGDGGAGTSNSITGSAVTYSGGGGGGSNSGTAGSGGAGGGGAGSTSSTTATSGTANTGGGGGGAGTGISGDGGSGIVIVRVRTN